MAESAPVNDVLCGAVEYLVKLGSNLRQRSEVLQNKRIKKDKLKNTHAVQKAASKVLLICELSKKSIDTVEASVKTILSQIASLQANISSGKSSNSENISQYQYFVYNSRRLKIQSKLNFKHYTSVKVIASELPIAMQDKYPVYYDCKLYRLRRKSINLISENKNVEECDQLESNNKVVSNLLDVEKADNAKDNGCDKTLQNNDTAIQNGDDDSQVTFHSDFPHEKYRKNNTHGVERRNKDKSVDKCSLKMESNKKNKETLFKIVDDRSNHQENASENELITLNMEKGIESIDTLHINSQNMKTDTLDKIIGEEIDISKDVINYSEKKETYHLFDNSHVTVNTNCAHSLSNDQNNINSKEGINSELLTKDNTQDVSSQKKFVCEENNIKGTNNYESDTSVDTTKTSFIKCVNINKLLRADKLTKIIPARASCGKNVTPNRNTTKPSLSKSHFSVPVKTKKNDKYKNRKEKKFKPKEFTVKITRLPKLNVKFLESQNLRRIIHNETVLCKLVSKSEEYKCASSPSEDIDSVKKSLLLVSDSENTEEEFQQIKKKRNNSTLYNSDSYIEHSTESIKKAEEELLVASNLKECSNNDIENVHKSPNAAVKDNNDTGTIISKKQIRIVGCHTNTKAEVCDEKSKTDSQRILKTPDVTSHQALNISKNGDLLLENSNTSENKQDPVQIPPSKRKKIMENMETKKMLLTDSSSSETEDEKLRDVLNQMKADLLKGDDSDANKMSSSDSDCLSFKCKNIKDGSRSSSKSMTGQERSGATVKDEIKSIGSDPSAKMDHSNGKSSSGSQHSNSEESDKEIDGLTNLKTLKRSHRRTQQSKIHDRWREFRMAKMPKMPVMSEEVLLQPDSNSDAESIGSNEDCEVEELPRVPVAGLNGDGETMAKDDLLGDSDSSISQNQNKSSQDDKEGDSEEDNVKSKRRKANAISSDSEAGSSRRKERRISDFEDSDDDGLEVVKKSKRKKNRSDSDASGGSNTDGKKKRRRIKNMDDSDGSGSETENEGRYKHGRKNIRKVMGKNQLEEATKKAAREEKERIARIAERQKLYNNLLFDESGKPDEVVLDKVVLDFDPETKEPIIEVDKGLVKKLKPHQANGIKFMWDACFESVKRIKKNKGSGCILAHCMGLGKTLQVVSLTHTLLIHSDLTSVNRVLVVCPLSTVLNWVNEFKMWLKHAETEYEVDVYELSRFKQNSDRAYQLSQWYQHGGVCVLGYEMFRNLSSDSNKKFKKKMLKNFQESLVDPGPDLVVCDEGHLLKNEKTSLSQAMNKVKTLRRIVLTGTPLQNNLKEYYCMVQFVKPNLLGKYNEYLNRFVNPITNGQYTDSTEHDIKIMKRRSHVLHKMLDGAVQRRDYGVLAPFLPPKHEYVLFITLTDVQIQLYTHYLDNYSRKPLPGKSSGFLFPDFQSLQRIWTHPLVLKYNSERYEIMQQKKREREEEDSAGSLEDFIDDDSTPEGSTSEESTEYFSDMSNDSRKKSKKKKSLKQNKRTTRRGTRANPVELDDDDVQEVVEVKNENPTEWWMSLVNEEELEDMRNSHKLVLLFDILRQCEAIGDKLLVFSQSLYSLDLIEHFLAKVDEATQEGRVDEKLRGHVGSWAPGVDYFRLDGSTSCENRSIWCKNFNREDNPRARLFLISTRAGGLGINLVAANRVVIFDVSWNPSHDVQSIFRVYRFGQKKPCYIYRFLVMGTMEEKIYERQVTKQAISKRVIDEQQIDRHYAENDLAELYKFEPKPPQPRPIPPLPKDRLFAEMLKEHDLLIYKYHEHDSLLENKEEETLTEEERKAAWEDFENEKTRPPPMPFPSPYTMHNGMMSGLLAQQHQQQLAYSVVADMLRKEAPTMTENQIRDMMLLCSANPQMMQKVNEMYKYPQSGMVNPALMNAVMNAGGGGGMPMGGTSGLQYEPPWQRQQQMRLQQLMQQQNIGAKYYAGGLGSRDPVAMALQHQRAREMMLGERSRPRGRPPHREPLTADRANRPAPQDIVNLDSD